MLKNKKIAFYIEDGRFAGPHQYILELSKELKKQGYSVVILLPKYESEFFVSKLERNDVDYILLNINRLTKQRGLLLKYIMSFFIELFTISHAIKKQNIDIINIVGGAWQFKGVLASLLAKVKIVWRLNDTMMPNIIKKIFNILSSYVDGIIVNGSGVFKYYINDDIKNRNIFNIQSPVDVNYFTPSICKQKSSNKVVITSIGNVNPVKGYEFFIQMALKLNKEFDNLEFNIAGKLNDSQKDYISDLKKIKGTESNINFLGMVNDTRGLLCKTDIYVCSSISEASPIAVWEAMSMGKVIVSTEVGDVAKIIVNNESGFIANIKSSDDLFVKVKSVLQDFDNVKGIGINARNIAINSFSVEKITKKHISIYENLITNKEL